MLQLLKVAQLRGVPFEAGSGLADPLSNAGAGGVIDRQTDAPRVRLGEVFAGALDAVAVTRVRGRLAPVLVIGGDLGAEGHHAAFPRGVSNPALQARVMAALRLPAGMLPFLRDGAKGIEEYRREAQRLGATNDAGARAARSFERAFSRLGLAGEGLTNTIAARLEPVLVPLLNRLTEWLVVAGPGIAATIERIAKAFERWVDEGGLDRLGTTIGEIFTGIGNVVGAMGGWENAAIALGVVLTANLLAPLTRITAALAGITALRLPAWLLRLLPLAAAAGMVGAAGGEDPEFSRQRNEEWLRNNPRDPSMSAPDRPQAPVINQFFSSVGRVFERAFSPRGGDRSVQGSEPPTTRPPAGENGRLSDDQLTSIGVGRHRLANDAAAAYQRMVEAARADGIAWGVTDSYRDFAAQQRVAAEKGIYGRGGLAAVPGRSQHGWGRALDLSSSAGGRLGAREVEWLRANGGRFGFETIPREPWHWQYNGRPTSPADTPMPSDAPAPTAASSPAAGAAQRVDVRVTLAGPGSEVATITSRSDDGGVRIQRPSLGVTP